MVFFGVRSRIILEEPVLMPQRDAKPAPTILLM
jgi:hypothetical protein